MTISLTCHPCQWSATLTSKRSGAGPSHSGTPFPGLTFGRLFRETWKGIPYRWVDSRPWLICNIVYWERRWTMLRKVICGTLMLET